MDAVPESSDDRELRRARIRAYYEKERDRLNRDNSRPIWPHLLGVGSVIIGMIIVYRSRYRLPLATASALVGVGGFLYSSFRPAGHRGTIILYSTVLGSPCAIILIKMAMSINAFIGMTALLICLVLLIFIKSLADAESFRLAYYTEHGLPPFEKVDHWDEVEEKISAHTSYAVFLRAFSGEAPRGFDFDTERGTYGRVDVDLRPEDAVRRLIRRLPTYCFLNPNDPIHRTYFTTVLADPDNWTAELKYLLKHASIILVLYEGSTPGLDTEIDIVTSESELGDKAVVFHHAVRANDALLMRMGENFAWVFQLSFERQPSDGWPEMIVRAPIDFLSWLKARASLVTIETQATSLSQR